VSLKRVDASVGLFDPVVGVCSGMTRIDDEVKQSDMICESSVKAEL
jgi:hypothetical protein